MIRDNFLEINMILMDLSVVFDIGSKFKTKYGYLVMDIIIPKFDGFIYSFLPEDISPFDQDEYLRA